MWMSVSLFFTPIYLSLLRELEFFLKNSSSSEVLPPSIDYSGVGYTIQELKALEKFRHLLSDVIQSNDPFSDDQFLMLWLRKEHFDLDSANQKFRGALEWRKSNHMESLMNESILESFPDLCRVDGIAKDGSPIITMRAAGLDLRRLVLAGLGSNVTRRTYQCLEGGLIKSIELTKSTGKIIGQSLVILDAEGFNRLQHACARCMQVFLRFLRESDEFWPDLLRLVVIINAPTIAKPVVDFALPLIQPSRRNVTKIFGVDRKEWSSYLGTIISPDQLSIKFGGTRLH